IEAIVASFSRPVVRVGAGRVGGAATRIRQRIERGARSRMQVRDGMSPMVLTVGPRHTLRAVARLMGEREVGAAAVMDPDGPGPAIITERDILQSIGTGQDPDGESVGDHLTRNVVYAAPDWSLEEAAAAMVQGGFRHLI